MERHTQEQRLQIIKFYYQNNRSPIATFRALLPFYGHNKKYRKDAVNKQNCLFWCEKNPQIIYEQQLVFGLAESSVYFFRNEPLLSKECGIDQ